MFKKENKPTSTRALVGVNILVLFGVFCISILFFNWMYTAQNKYTASSPRAVNGVLTLSPEEYKKPLFLIDDWAFYQGRLLTPKDDLPEPDAYVFIGQYSGFNLDDKTKTTYGDATYRLNIFTGNDEPKNYMLELPEIFSSYNLWINGELMYAGGLTTKNGYMPETANSSITFEATDRIEIMVAVSNYSHYYSGMVYPPAFGSVKAVGLMLEQRLFFSYVICIIAITACIFYLMIGVFVKSRRVYLLYGIVCLLFSTASSYSIVHNLQLPGMAFWYVLEDFSFFAMLLCIGLLSAYVCKTPRRLVNVFFIIGVVICAVVVIVPLFVLNGSWGYLLLYSKLLDLYKIVVVVFLFFATVRAVKERIAYSAALLCGIEVFAVSLVVDIFVPLFEPIVLCWPIEIGSFVLVCTLGTVMVLTTIEDYKSQARYLIENAVLLENTRMTQIQLGLMSRQYQGLEEHISATERARHDLRHHISVVQEYLANGDAGRLKDYLHEYQQTIPASRQIRFCTHPIINSIVSHYAALGEALGVKTKIELNLPDQLVVSDTDLCIIFGNCLENAVEACKRIEDGERFIHLHAKIAGDMLSIVVRNSFDGTLYKQGDTFFSRKRDEEGIGISSVRAVAARYQGHTRFEGSDQVFTASVMLVCMK